MRRVVHFGWCLLAVTPLLAADPPKPSADERADIQRLLTKDLTAFEGKDRVAACRALGVYGPKAAEAVAKLIERVEKDNTGVVQAAADALAEIGDPKAVDPLLVAARKSNFTEARVACLRAASKLDPAKATVLAALRAALSDDKAEVVLGAAASLHANPNATDGDRLAIDHAVTPWALKKKPEARDLLEAISIDRIPADEKPIADDLLRLDAFVEKGGANAKAAANAKKAAIIKAFAPDLYPDWLKLLAEDARDGVRRVAAEIADALPADNLFAALTPLATNGDATRLYAEGEIRRRGKADPKAFRALLDGCLAKPDQKHAEMVFRAAVRIDGDDRAYTLALLGAKAAVARRVGFTARPTVRPPVALVPLLSGGLDDPDADVRKAAVAYYRFGSHRTHLPDAEWLAMLVDKSFEKRALAVELVSRPRDVAALPALARRLDDPDPEVRKAVTASVVGLIQVAFEDTNRPADDTTKLVRGLTAATSEVVRAAAVRFHVRSDVAVAVPLAKWVEWADDPAAEVRASAVGGLASLRAKEKVAADKLKALAADPNPDVRAAVSAAAFAADPSNRFLFRLLTEDTTAVARVKLLALLELGPVQKVALTPALRKQIKDSPAFRKFRFDPLKDLHELTLLYRETDRPEEQAVVYLRGLFDKEPKGKGIDLADHGLTGWALCFNDGILMAGQSKDLLDAAFKSEAGVKAVKNPLVGLIPKDDSKLLAWVAAKWPEFLRKEDFFRFVGIQIPDTLWDAAPGLIVTAEIDKGDWRFLLRVPAKDEESAEGWQGILNQLIDVFKTFGPLVGGQRPRAKSLIDATVAGIGKAKQEGKAVTVELVIDGKTMEKILQDLFGDE